MSIWRESSTTIVPALKEEEMEKIVYIFPFIVSWCLSNLKLFIYFSRSDDRRFTVYQLPDPIFVGSWARQKFSRHLYYCHFLDLLIYVLSLSLSLFRSQKYSPSSSQRFSLSAAYADFLATYVTHFNLILWRRKTRCVTHLERKRKEKTSHRVVKEKQVNSSQHKRGRSSRGFLNSWDKTNIFFLSRIIGYGEKISERRQFFISSRGAYFLRLLFLCIPFTVGRTVNGCFYICDGSTELSACSYEDSLNVNSNYSGTTACPSHLNLVERYREWEWKKSNKKAIFFQLVWNSYNSELNRS